MMASEPRQGRLYRYVGPAEIRARAAKGPAAEPVRSDAELLDRLVALGLRIRRGTSITVTFVIDSEGQLRIADRHAEHVLCAGGGEVLSAGEMTFEGRSRGCIVRQVTNQSTGYCPEPSSWSSVAAALERLGLRFPNGFDPSFEFRRCRACREISIVKEGWLQCAQCGAELPVEWNVDENERLKEGSPLTP